MIDISAIQSALCEFGIDGWLLYDFRGSNVLVQRVLGLAPSEIGSRRYAYCIPARGEPRKLVHRIEAGALAGLPGSKTVYLRWQEFEAGLGQLLAVLKRVAMEYSPHNAIPYVSRVDAGTIELVKKLGVEVVSSGDLIQVFEAAWDDEQERSHFDAAVLTDAAYTRAWRFIADAVRRRTAVDEVAVQAEILKHFAENGRGNSPVFVEPYQLRILGEIAHALVVGFFGIGEQPAEVREPKPASGIVWIAIGVGILVMSSVMRSPPQCTLL